MAAEQNNWKLSQTPFETGYAAANMELISCGCKGARSCAVCQNSDRVKALKSNSEDWRQYSAFVFCKHCRRLHPTIFNESTFAIESIIQASHLPCPGASGESQSAASTFSLDGLLLIDDFITLEEETELCKVIEQKEWALSQSGRRKQDFGPKVNFKQKKVKWEGCFTGMPEYADLLLQRMRDVGGGRLGDYDPFELCNLEYSPFRGSGISFHQDDMWIWGNRLISINLLSGSVMSFIQPSTSRLLFVPMPHRSLLCMADACRYEWQHGILPEHITDRRIALTMREPSDSFRPGGELYEKFGKTLLEIGAKRVKG